MDMDGEEKAGSMAELLEQIGDVPLSRIRMRPAPGTATEEDVLKALEALRKRICELVEGVLIEKPMGAREATLAIWLSHYFCDYLEEHDIGTGMAPDGPVKVAPKRVRFPDVCFISWDRLPEGEIPENQRILEAIPDLAIEILSESNTPAEMDLKRRDYFLAGVRLVWVINPKTQTAEVFTSPTDKKRISKTGSLQGGEVLPGFRLPLHQLFSKTRKRSA